MTLSQFLTGSQTAVAMFNQTEIIFNVHLPENTPMDAIFLAGSLPELGKWKADGIKLERIDDRRARKRLLVNPSTLLEFKITRGSWATVEKNRDGSERSNRKIEITKSSSSETQSSIIVDVVVEAWADFAPLRPHTLSGDIRFHNNFQSNILNNNRTLAVYLPPGYNKSKLSYPVLYMHDGQNIFDSATSFSGVEWGVDEACEKLISKKIIKPIIVVGIYNNDKRIDEYTPVLSTNETHQGGGKGDLYAQFIIDEVKPFIDKMYRTKKSRSHTAIMGSSLGGLISLHIALKRADIFSQAGVVSPALWWGNREILKRIKKMTPSKQKTRLWIDMGTKEGETHPSFVESMNELMELSSLLKKNGWREGRNLCTYIAEGAAHNEEAWSKRIELILTFLYGIKHN